MTSTSRFRRTRRAAVATALVSALTLSACSSASTGATEEEEAILTVGSPMSITSIDPHGPGSGDRPTITAAQHVFDTLVRREGAEFVPHLATSWDNPDELTWRFELKPDVVFHDGTPVTAADVVASYERLVGLEGPLTAQWAAVESFEAEGDHAVVVTTTEPLGTMLSNLALLFVAPAAGMDEPDFFLDPVGSGPFVVEDYRVNDQLVLTANADYWGTVPEVDRLIIRDIPEVSTLVTAIETGEVDLTWGLPPDQVGSLLGNDAVTVESMPSFVYYMNWFNSAREPFTDERVRRAMWHAVDTEALVSDLFAGSAEVATAPIPSTVFGHAAQTPYEYDPEKAKQLLAEAGYPDGFATTLDVSNGGGPQIREIAQTLISDWQAIGVDVTLAEKERAVWLEDLIALEWDMNLLINSVLTGDADFTLGRLYPTAANRTGYGNPELDEVLSQARASLDQEERETLYAEANRIIWEDAVGVFPMELLATYAWRDNVSGFEPDPNETPLFTTVSVS